jgi:hypothetical protein
MNQVAIEEWILSRRSNTVAHACALIDRLAASATTSDGQRVVLMRASIADAAKIPTHTNVSSIHRPMDSARSILCNPCRDRMAEGAVMTNRIVRALQHHT